MQRTIPCVAGGGSVNGSVKPASGSNALLWGSLITSVAVLSAAGTESFLVEVESAFAESRTTSAAIELIVPLVVPISASILFVALPVESSGSDAISSTASVSRGNNSLLLHPQSSEHKIPQTPNVFFTFTLRL